MYAMKFKLYQTFCVIFLSLLVIICFNSVKAETTTKQLSEEELVLFQKLNSNQQKKILEEDIGIGEVPTIKREVKVGSNTANAIPTTSNATAIAAEEVKINMTPVVDEAKILSSSEKQQLNQQLINIYKQGLAQIGVVIIPSLDGQDIFDYGMTLADRWQLGNDATDDGLLILVSVNDAKMHIFTGYGMEGVIPDVVASRIIRNDMIPYFKRNDYAGGLKAGIKRIEKRLTTDPQTLAQADKLAQERETDFSSASNSASSHGIDPIFLFFAALFGGNMVVSMIGRILGGVVVSLGFFILSLTFGASWFMASILAIFLLIFLLGMSGRGGRRHRRSRNVIISGGHYDTGSSDSFGGSFGNSGGFGGGDSFSGGGGDFGGGGAGGSW